MAMKVDDMFELFELPAEHSFINVAKNPGLADKFMQRLYPGDLIRQSGPNMWDDGEGVEQIKIDFIITTPVSDFEIVRRAVSTEYVEHANILFVTDPPSLARTFMAKLLCMYPKSRFVEEPENIILKTDLFSKGGDGAPFYFIAAADFDIGAMAMTVSPRP